MRSLPEAADFVGKTMERLQLVGHHRFRKMMAAIAGGDNVVEPEDEHFSAARCAIRDVRILEFCIDNLHGGIDEVVFTSKLQEVIKDPLSPVDKPRRGTLGRNIQAELFVAAICQKALMSPRFEEPDLVVRMCDGDLAIAVKRPQSGSNLSRRIVEAVGQIRHSGHPGVVVVDGSLMCNPKDLELRGNLPPDSLTDAACGYVRELARRELASWKRGVRGMELVAIVFQFHVLQNRFSNDWGLNSVTIPFNPNESNKRRTESFCRFADAFAKGLPD